MPIVLLILVISLIAKPQNVYTRVHFEARDFGAKNVRCGPIQIACNETVVH